MSEKDLGHPCCSSFLHGGIFVPRSPCRLLAGAATLLSRLAEHGGVVALALWWQIPVPPHRMEDAHHPLGSDVTCPKAGELLLSYSNSLGRGGWGRCLAEGAPCSTLRCSAHPGLVLVAQPCHVCRSLSQPGCPLNPFHTLPYICPCRHLQFLFLPESSHLHPWNPREISAATPDLSRVFGKCRSLGYEL